MGLLLVIYGQRSIVYVYIDMCGEDTNCTFISFRCHQLLPHLQQEYTVQIKLVALTVNLREKRFDNIEFPYNNVLDVFVSIQVQLNIETSRE